MRTLAAGLFLLLALASGTARADWRFSRVTGAEGVQLNVVEAGNPAGPAIVFVHGIGQSHLAFEPQLRSALGERYRLIAYDLRGHGNSDKPDTRASYADTRPWADDLQAVLRATRATPALLVGWSYGTIVIMDYVRHHGTRELAGIMLVSAEGGLTISGPRPAMSGPEAERIAAMHRRQEGPDLEGNVAAARELARMLTAKPMPEAWTERAALVAMRVPGPVWAYLRAQPIANNDLRDRLDLPVRLVLGRHDGGIPEPVARQLAGTLPDAAVVMFEDSGHTPFVEEAAAFDEQLAAFARAVHSAAASESPTR